MPVYKYLEHRVYYATGGFDTAATAHPIRGNPGCGLCPSIKPGVNSGRDSMRHQLDGHFLRYLEDARKRGFHEKNSPIEEAVLIFRAMNWNAVYFLQTQRLFPRLKLEKPLRTWDDMRGQ